MEKGFAFASSKKRERSEQSQRRSCWSYINCLNMKIRVVDGGDEKDKATDRMTCSDSMRLHNQMCVGLMKDLTTKTKSNELSFLIFDGMNCETSRAVVAANKGVKLNNIMIHNQHLVFKPIDRTKPFPQVLSDIFLSISDIFLSIPDNSLFDCVFGDDFRVLSYLFQNNNLKRVSVIGMIPSVSAPNMESDFDSLCRHYNFHFKRSGLYAKLMSQKYYDISDCSWLEAKLPVLKDDIVTEDEDVVVPLVNIQQKRAKRDVTRVKFKRGDMLEAECDDEYLLYEDTICIVEYRRYDHKLGHRCVIVGMSETYSWKTHELHERRGVERDSKFNIGDNVHVKIVNRTGIDESGTKTLFLDKEPVWVKAIVIDVHEDGYTVEHITWNAHEENRGPRTSVRVKSNLVRSSY